MSDLVQRLSEGEHPVSIVCRPETTLEEFRAAIDRGFIHVKFTETRGGTELGIEVDDSRLDLTDGDLQTGTGRLQVNGDLELDFIPVRLVADIDLQTLAGTGKLEIRN